MKKIFDERIVASQNKFMSEAFGIAFAIGMGSSFIKGVILDMPVSSWIMEFAIIMIPSLYFTLRSLIAGVFLNSPKQNSHFKKLNIFSSIFSGILFGVLQFFFIDTGKTINNKHNLISAIISAIFFGTFMHFGMKFLNKKSEKIGNDKLNKLENKD